MVTVFYGFVEKTIHFEFLVFEKFTSEERTFKT